MNNLNLSHNFSKSFHDYFKTSLSKFSKPIKKNFVEISRGILISGACILSMQIRATNKNIFVRKGVERFSAFLENFYDLDLEVFRILNKHSSNISINTPIFIDNTDTIKEYAEAMEGLSKVHDGSKNEIANGYEIFGSGYLDNDYKYHQLLFELFSRTEENYKSDYDEWKKNILKILSIIGPEKGIYVMDCGYDGNNYLNFLLKNSLRFCMRMNLGRIHKRQIFWNNEKRNFDEVEFQDEQRFIRKTKKGRNEYVSISWTKVKLTEDGDFLNLVKIVREKYLQPMYLLTTEDIDTKQKKKNILELYLSRWKIEEHFRVLKTNFKIEGVQLRTLKRIKGLYRLICWLSNFLTSKSKQILKNTFSQEYQLVKIYKSKTQGLSVFTALVMIFRDIWSHLKDNYHLWYFRSLHKTINSSQQALFSKILLSNLTKKW
jgi:hypothetical protein